MDTLEKYSPTITKPDMTKLLEENMDKIAEGKSKRKLSLKSPARCSSRSFLNSYKTGIIS